MYNKKKHFFFIIFLASVFSQSSPLFSHPEYESIKRKKTLVLHRLFEYIHNPLSISVASYNKIYELFFLKAPYIAYLLRKAAIQSYGVNINTLLQILHDPISILMHIKNEPYCIYSGNSSLHSSAMSVQKDVLLLTEIIKKMKTFTPDQFTFLYYLASTLPDPNIKITLFNYAKSRFGLQKISDTTHANDLINIYRFSQQYDKHWLGANLGLEKPIFLYSSMPTVKQMLKTTLRMISQVTPDNLEYLYYDILSSESDRAILKKAATKHFALYNPTISTCINQAHLIPSFMCDTAENDLQATFSELHYYSNIRNIFSILRRYEKCKNHLIQQVFQKALAAQKKATSHNEYIFFHARRWEWNFISDIYKHVYNMAKVDQAGDDFVFLRFDDSKSPKPYVKDVLFLNCSLFGNSMYAALNSTLLFMQNHDWSKNNLHNKFSTEWIFSFFNLLTYFNRYKTEFNKLKELHQHANEYNCGELLALVIKPKDIEHVHLTAYTQFPPHYFFQPIDAHPIEVIINGEPTKDINRIMNFLKNKRPFPDLTEFVLSLDKDYALNPLHGPKIYSFHAANPKKWRQYEKLRDEIFAKIKADIQNDSHNKVPTSFLN